MQKLTKVKTNGGMTYVELIVVLSIFAAVSSVVVFNYTTFESKVDIKNTASDIALKIVEAQKSALAGLLPIGKNLDGNTDWKPAYGVYFNSSSALDITDGVAFNKKFLYFADLNQSGDIADFTCCSGDDEAIEKVLFQKEKGNSISHLDVFYQGGTSASLNDLSITFTRPNNGATIKSSTSFSGIVSYVQITIISPRSNTSVIKAYPSGRIQIN